MNWFKQAKRPSKEIEYTYTLEQTNGHKLRCGKISGSNVKEVYETLTDRLTGTIVGMEGSVIGIQKPHQKEKGSFYESDIYGEEGKTIGKLFLHPKDGELVTNKDCTKLNRNRQHK